jgi:membrane-bound lytic murein transglycosylase A
MRTSTLIIVLLTLVALLAGGYAIWLHRYVTELEGLLDEAPDEVAEDRLVLERRSFDDLPGWQSDSLIDALPALQRSCKVFQLRDAEATLEPAAVGGTIGDWQTPCGELTASHDETALRQVIEEHFLPVQVLNHSEATGLFTGYYEPSMPGSRERRDAGQVPLYRKPSDLVSIDLEKFHQSLEGRRISGRVAEGTFLPYYERADIVSGALAERQLELAWIDDPVDAFFLHIQGSGRVELPDGEELRVGYAGQNGRPYYAIGRELVARGALTIEQVSLQSIRQWLAENPDEAGNVMSTNPSFVFFTELEGEGPVGTMGVALTPGRSLAVDRTHLPMGIPVWLDGLAPHPEGGADQTLQRLLVAQDTGGAIKGPVRGDVFWGHGTDAEEVAGRMKHEGRLWVLLPRALALRVTQGD